MSLPSSPAPCYQPDKAFQSKVKLSNRALDVISSVDHSNALRRVASVPNTTDYFSSSISSSSSSNSTLDDLAPPPPLPLQVHSTPSSPRPSLRSSYSLQKDTVQVGPTDFEKVRLLGKGDVGRVYLVKHKQTKKLYALKGKADTSFCFDLLQLIYA